MNIPFILKNLAISRMPGFDRGMKAYRDFAAHINLISGPNASGKSSTARIIRQLIWRDDTEGIRAEGSAEIDGKKWDIHINSHSVLVQQEGIDAELKGLPAKESSRRYELALHKLVLERDEEIAQEIARLASGGYNLGKAEEQLGYASRTPDRRLAEYTACTAAREQRKRIEQRQQQLKEDENRLQLLKQQREDSAKAAQMLQLFEKVIAFKTAQQQKESAAAKLQQFPEVLQRATGRELAETEALEAEIVKLEQLVAVETAGLRKAEERLGQLQIPPGGISGEMLREMEERVMQLAELEREIAAADTELTKSGEAEHSAATAIGNNTDPEQWKGISLEGIGKLDEFLMKSHKTLSEKQYLQSCIEELNDQLNSDHPEPEMVKSGMAMLTAWLNSGGGYRNNRTGPTGIQRADSPLDGGSKSGAGRESSRTGPRKNQHAGSQPDYSSTGSSRRSISWNRVSWHLPAVAAAGAATAAAVHWLGGAGLLGLILVAVLTLLAYLRKKEADDGAERELRRRDYEGTGLPQPEQWSESDVLATLHQLQESLQSSLWQAKLMTEKEQYDKALKALQPALDEVAETADQLREKLKGFPELPEDDPKNYTGLYWFVVQVQRWQQHRENSDVLRAGLEKLRKAFSRELALLNTLFEKAVAEGTNTEGTGTEDTNAEGNGTEGNGTEGNGTEGTRAKGAKDRITAKAIFEGLKEQEETGRSTTASIKAHRERLKELEDSLDKLRKKIAGVYASLDLENGDRKALGMLMDRIGDYRSAADEWRSAVQRLEDRKAEMREHSLYEAFAETIGTMTIDGAEAERMQHKTEAEAWESRTREIAAIEAMIGEVRSGNSLETALLEEETALEVLRETFEKNLAAATGKLLTDQLRADSYGNNPSEVYVRANKLFSRITSGRYGLRIDERGNGGFRAYDNTLSRGQELEELSTGTRIQLLLSVRLAYIEQQEEGLKLPVLADELLANCDDTRAAAIIEALIAISKEGRQVFYFTAQADELAKWKYYLEKEKVEHRVFELNGGAGAADGVEGDEGDQRFLDHSRETDKSRSASGRDSAESGAHDNSRPATRGPKREPVKLFQEVPEPGRMSHEAYGKKIGPERFDPLTQEAEQIHLWYILEDTTVLFECLRRNISSWGQLSSFMEHGGSLPGLNEKMLSVFKSRLRLLQAFIALYRQGRPRSIDIVVLECSGAVSTTFIDAVNGLLEKLGNDPLALLDALKNKEVPGFRENKINELEEYLTAEGYISLQEKLDTDEIIRRLHAAFPEMGPDSEAVERMINRII